MRRSGYLKRRTPLRHVSAKRALQLSDRAELLAALSALSDLHCAAQPLAGGPCAGRLDAHEPLTRARGGSTTDPDNILWICRRHHGWLHRNPDEAHGLGLLVHSWERA